MPERRTHYLTGLGASALLHLLLSLGLIATEPAGLAHNRNPLPSQTINVQLVRTQNQGSHQGITQALLPSPLTPEKPRTSAEGKAPAPDIQPETANAPTIETDEGATTANTAPTNISGASPSFDLYRNLLTSHIHRFVRYPPRANQKNDQGLVWVSCVLDGRGNVVDVWVERSSGSAELDAEALNAVQRAQPLPPPPSYLGSNLRISIPIRFELK